MSYDYGCIHVFAGPDEATTVRARVIEQIRQSIAGRASTADRADRSIVIGPPDRWIFVGDTASGTDEGDPVAFDSLVDDLSTVAPTLAIKMSDSTCVHFYLRRNRELLDKFGTGKFPFYRFESDEEALPFRGVERLWRPFTLDDDGPARLRSIWDSKASAWQLVEPVANVLGIYPGLTECGFTTFNEAWEIYYREWLEDDPILLKQFDELHFEMAEAGD